MKPETVYVIRGKQLDVMAAKTCGPVTRDHVLVSMDECNEFAVMDSGDVFTDRRAAIHEAIDRCLKRLEALEKTLETTDPTRSVEETQSGDLPRSVFGSREQSELGDPSGSVTAKNGAHR